MKMNNISFFTFTQIIEENIIKNRQYKTNYSRYKKWYCVLKILVYNVQWTKSGDLINDIRHVFKS